MIDVTFIEGDTRARLHRLGKAVGLTVQQMGHEQMRLSSNSAIKFTYPRKKGDGVNRIAGDMLKVFWPMTGKYSSANGGAAIDKSFPAGDLVGLRLQGKAKAVVFSEQDKMLRGSSAGQMSGIHAEHRDRRTGKIKTKIKATRRDGKTIANKYIVSGAAFNRQLKVAGERVGQQKAGWLPAATYYAARSSGNVVAPPWVKAQKKQMGVYSDTMGKGGNGTMTATNTVPYWPERKRVALESLVHGIAQKRIDRTTQGQIDKLATRFNAGTI